MSLRQIKLPADLAPLVQVTSQSWQYPENKEWSVQPDETQSAADTVRNLRRIWPLIRLIQLFSPRQRDILQGYVWQQDDQIVGFSNTHRRGATDTWYISGAGVLPAYRRQNIGRKLIEATLDLIRERGGKRALGDVIAGNLPMYTLCEKLGFEHYDSRIVFIATPEQAPPAPSLPQEYTQEPLKPSDWQSRHQLEQRITPARLLKYEPVEEGRFRKSALTRLLYPLLALATGMRSVDFTIRTVTNNQIVAWARYETLAHPTATNSIMARLDPAHPELAPYLIGHMLHQVATLSPGRRLRFSVPQWMESLVVAAEKAGFQRQMTLQRIGLEL